MLIFIKLSNLMITYNLVSAFVYKQKLDLKAYNWHLKVNLSKIIPKYRVDMLYALANLKFSDFQVESTGFLGLRARPTCGQI